MKEKENFQNNSWILRFILYGVLAILALFLIFYVRLSQPQTISSGQTSISSSSSSSSSLPDTKKPVPASFAFPGAEGFGASSPGGRYGHTIFVTNLNDTTNVNSSEYVGSLRWALENIWPEDPSNPYGQRRIIVFKVGGII